MESKTKSIARKSRRAAQARARYNKDKKGGTEKVKDWRKKNPWSWIRSQSLQRAKKGGIEIFEITPKEIRDSYYEYDGRCAFCRIRPINDLDHMVPCRAGGVHRIDNLIPSCRYCDQSKDVLEGSRLAAWLTWVGARDPDGRLAKLTGFDTCREPWDDEADLRDYYELLELGEVKVPTYTLINSAPGSIEERWANEPLLDGDPEDPMERKMPRMRFIPPGQEEDKDESASGSENESE